MAAPTNPGAEDLRLMRMDLAEVEADLSAQQAQIVELWAAVATLQQRLRGRRRKPRIDAATQVEALRTHFKQRTFRPSDVQQHADLAALLVPASDYPTTQQIGIRLGLLTKRPTGAYRVEAVVRDDAGWLWSIVSVSVESPPVEAQHEHHDDSTSRSRSQCR